MVSPLHDLVTAHRALFEIARGLTPELWGPIAQGAGGEPVAAAPVTELLARLATALEDIETRLVTDARTWLASPAVQAAPRPPHLALLHAFLRLLDAPRARMNEFTANHLRYHYETILGQAPRGPRADRAFVVLKAAPPTPSAAFVPVFLPAGTVLAAGKDAAGGERTYQLCADVQVDLAAVARLLTLSSRPGPATASGQQLVASDSSAGPQAAPAEVGFALMSSIFALAGGNRTISVAMQLGVAPATLAAVAYFNVYATGPDGWILLDQQAVLDAGGLALDAALDARRPAIVEHRAAVHGRCFTNATAPVLRFVLDQAGSPTPASALAQITLVAADVTVTVDRTPAVQIAGPAGPLALGKPFAPLGYTPPAGAALLIACPEALAKRLTQLTLTLSWYNLPGPPLYVEDLATYYAGYELGMPGYVRPLPPTISPAPAATAKAPSPTPPLDSLVAPTAMTRADFQVVVGYRQGGAWHALSDQVPLFVSLTDTTICLDGTAGRALPSPAGRPSTPIQWQPLPPDGLLQVQLTAPSYGFGTALYPIATAQLASWNVDYVIDKVRNSTTTLKPPFVALSPPLTPLATDIAVGYHATAALDGYHRDDLALYRLTPWLAEPVAMRQGSRRLAPEPVPLFADVLQGWTVTAAVTATRPGQQLACLVVLDTHGQLAAGASGRAAVTWTYRSSAGAWASLRVEDRTDQLCRSGIVSFEVPFDAADWAGMGTGLLWVRAEIANPADYVLLPAVASVTAQATECARVMTVPGDAYDVPLSPGTIVGLKIANPRIAGLSQPLATSGGQRAEDRDAMYKRVSERARHKNRAITAWDFERLTLQRYPSLFAARCLPGVERQPDGSFQRVDRGVVTLLVSPRIYDPTALSRDQYPPAVDDATLGEIQQALAALAPASARIEVWNPVYVLVTVTARLTARPGQDPSMLGPKLDAELRAFLSPWIFQPVTAPSLTGPESTTQVRRFLAGRPDVQAVQTLSCQLGASQIDGSLQLPASPWLIPVSAWQHDLAVALSAR
ncbi:MAG TPA: baseplate J/gp47 family protein [Kofleriaceae bacterium]|nr:baseplate J/gp47 family protein [Kofleriaceae bacterium]